MLVGDSHVFPGFLAQVLTQLFFPKPPTTFLTCFCRGERRKYAGKKVRLYQGSNSQPLASESDTLTSEPPGRGSSKLKGFADGTFKFDEKGVKFSKRAVKYSEKRKNCSLRAIPPFPTVFSKDLFCRQVKTRVCLGKGQKICNWTNCR